MIAIYALFFMAGLAALSWEALWQLETSLAIGISAKGTALTLAITMGGMALGSALMGRALRSRQVARPLRVYGVLEMLVGVMGLVLFLPGLGVVERLDSTIDVGRETLASIVRVAGIAAVLGPAAVAMGATIPVIGLVARASRSSLASLYAANTAGACVGVLIASFALLPYLGVTHTAYAIAIVNFAVGGLAMSSSLRGLDIAERPRDAVEAPVPSAWLVVIASGFLSFALEVAWFRALRAAFLATTQGFAVMLATVLLALYAGARFVPWLERKKIPLGATLAAAGVAVLLATPVLERFDALAAASALETSWMRIPMWIAAAFVVVGPGMLLLGTCLPWVLDRYVDPPQWGRAYATNTLAAVAGSLACGWILLPALGFARTSWLLGTAAMACGLPLLATARSRAIAVSATILALLVAVASESGVGRSRVISNLGSSVARVVAFEEGPDSTIAVTETSDGLRVLLIDGFAASNSPTAGANYMVWMGRLPMMLHPAPKQALVICFGTGQTANAVRSEGPEWLDIVDLNAAVYRMAPFFGANQHVLDDPRVHATVMDGRAWLRRTPRIYDVITLEPMPPTFAGVNALYSREFYETAARHLNDGGTIAQWVPFHILSLHDALAIVATFQEVFPDSLLWIDQRGATGIVVGRKGGARDFGSAWPGLEGSRAALARDLDGATVRARVAAGPGAMAAYAKKGAIVTDDNQLLSYGPQRYRFFDASMKEEALRFFVQPTAATPRETAPP
ncbi:MAG: spermidine synthase [Myxococcaceae bacterium]|nr:spermidine synthase [Myxococcaceae bacterium]